MRKLTLTLPTPTTHHANVQLLEHHLAQKLLTTDLRDAGNVLLFAYLIHVPWFEHLFTDHLQRDHLYVLADDHQRTTAVELTRKFKKFHAATWPANRTMHDKTIIFPQRSLVYFTTSNLTRGSWTLSLNGTLRVESHSLAQRLAQHFHLHYAGARPVLPSELP